MIRKRKSYAVEGKERRVFGYVTRVEQLGDTLLGRTSFEFDAIDADTPEDELIQALENPSVLKPFSAIRIITTEGRFAQLFGFIPVEGSWVELDLFTKYTQPGPITLLSQLQENGYSTHQRVTIFGANHLFDPDDRPPKLRSLGASVVASRQMASTLVRQCNFPEDAVGPQYRVRAILRSLRNADSIIVRDVGQASFSSIISREGELLAHFDAGWPISFNMRTAPAAPPSISGTAPVILSHWDWDHLHAYYHCPSLRQVRWLTPVQPAGPGAQKIARQLRNADLLVGYSGPEIGFCSVVLVPCSGGGLNNSGLSLVLLLKSGKIALLVGDADYQDLGAQWSTTRFDLLSVTHHGAYFEGQPPLATNGNGSAVISVGRGNVYQHPKFASVLRHRRVGWNIEMTAGTRRHRRADKQLGP